MAALSASRLVWSAISLISARRAPISLTRLGQGDGALAGRVGCRVSACSRLSRVSAVWRATSSTVSAIADGGPGQLLGRRRGLGHRGALLGRRRRQLVRRRRQLRRRRVHLHPAVGSHRRSPAACGPREPNSHAAPTASGVPMATMTMARCAGRGPGRTVAGGVLDQDHPAEVVETADPPTTSWPSGRCNGRPRTRARGLRVAALSTVDRGRRRRARRRHR